MAVGREDVDWAKVRDLVQQATAVGRIALPKTSFKALMTQTISSGWLSRHNRGTLAFLAVLVVLFLLFAFALFDPGDWVEGLFGRGGAAQATPGDQISLGPKEKLAAVVAVFGVFFAFFGRLQEIAMRRKSTAELFAREILTILRVYNDSNIVFGFILAYLDPESGDFIPEMRRENYFELFHRKLQDLGELDREAIFYTTAFYTYLKTSRDASGVLARWNQPDAVALTLERKRLDVVNICYLIFLTLDSGYEALQTLYEYRDLKKESEIIGIVIGYSWVMAFLFLMNVKLEEIGPGRRNIVELQADRAKEFIRTVWPDVAAQMGFAAT